jgi:hypothetical protein
MEDDFFFHVRHKALNHIPLEEFTDRRFYFWILRIAPDHFEYIPLRLSVDNQADSALLHFIQFNSQRLSNPYTGAQSYPDH